MLPKSISHKDIVLSLSVLLCCFPLATAPVALAAGIAIGIFLGNPRKELCSIWSKRLLQLSVVGLGFGVNLPIVLKTGKEAFVYTAISIALTMIVGPLIGKLLKTEARTSLLISFGTAICGGSAIAALAPVIKAKSEETGVALATIFTLNAIALLLFPLLGHAFGLDQNQFGLWAALAIHDTSSVVGAASAFGATALAIGTTVKLTRALWIMPSAVIASLITNSKGKVAIPFFIIGFLLAAALRSYIPNLENIWLTIHATARQSLVVTLLLIGSGLTREVLKKTGLKPMLQGVALWLIVSATSLQAILLGWIK